MCEVMVQNFSLVLLFLFFGGAGVLKSGYCICYTGALPLQPSPQLV
jgi:hypothetical protein